jgi:arylsulfatase A-like enzyme
MSQLFCRGADYVNSSARGHFGDSLLEMDAAVGNVMSSLKKVGQLNNTIVIFTSDNG